MVSDEMRAHRGIPISNLKGTWQLWAVPVTVGRTGRSTTLFRPQVGSKVETTERSMSRLQLQDHYPERKDNWRAGPRDMSNAGAEMLSALAGVNRPAIPRVSSLF